MRCGTESCGRRAKRTARWRQNGRTRTRPVCVPCSLALERGANGIARTTRLELLTGTEAVET